MSITANSIKKDTDKERLNKSIESKKNALSSNKIVKK